MSNTILQKRRITTVAPPLYSDLLLGELAVNTKTGRLFMRDNWDAIIDIGTNVIDTSVVYNGTTPVQLELDGAYRGDLTVHRGMGYTFRLEPVGNGHGISGSDILFYTQANPDAPHIEYTTDVLHADFNATIYITEDTPDNLKFGIRDGSTTTAIDNSGGSIVYSEQSGIAGSADKLSDSDAVFEWDTVPDVWKTGHDEGLQASSGKLVLDDIILQSSGGNKITFAAETQLDNIVVDGGSYS